MESFVRRRALQALGALAPGTQLVHAGAVAARLQDERSWA